MRVHADLYGNGKPGLLPKMQDFITRHDTLEEERDRQHKSNRWRLNAIIALMMLLIALLAAAPAIRAVFKSSVDYLPDVFHSEIYVASGTFDAIIPPL